MAAAARRARRHAAGPGIHAIETDGLTAVGQRRLQAGLTPDIALSCQTVDGKVTLMLELTGPPALDRLDMVHVRIRDDMPGPEPARGPPAVGKDPGEPVRGPYRINPGLHRTDPHGRAHGPFPLQRNQQYRIPIQESLAPPRNPDWPPRRDHHQAGMMRLEITCLRAGHDLWVLPAEVGIHLPPGSAAHWRAQGAGSAGNQP